MKESSSSFFSLSLHFIFYFFKGHLKQDGWKQKTVYFSNTSFMQPLEHCSFLFFPCQAGHVMVLLDLRPRQVSSLIEMLKVTFYD